MASRMTCKSSSDQAARQSWTTPTSIEDLPPELLGHLVCYIQEVQTLLRLGLACKKLHEYVQNDGHRIFVQSHYPWIPIPPSWKDAVHAMTKLSRAWDRKSLIPRYIKPPHNAAIAATLTTGRMRRRGQTMGYQPVIDSYDTWIGSGWTSRRETVAWGAGAELVLRVKWMGPDVEQEWRQAGHGQPVGTCFDQHHHKSRWWKILEPTQTDGKDDITTVMLLRETQKSSPGAEYIIVGRASGGLDLLSITHVAPGSWKREIRFQTNGQNVRAATVNAAIPPLLAACLGDRTIAIYHVLSPASYVASFTDPVDSTAAIYSLLPLGRDRFLAGSAQFATIKLFNMRTAVDKLCHDRHSSVAPLETSSVESFSPGDVEASVYPGELEPRSHQKSELHDWTVFLANRDGRNEGQQRRNAWRPREWTSPVYSLSSPSLYSPVFFAGIEDHVIQVDVTSAYDRFPDPIYKSGLASSRTLPRDAARRWDPDDDVMCVDLYEHSYANINIMHQTRIGERKPGDQMQGWDERWYPRGGKSTPR
ncbi:MAG: hypothetical protein Q9182_007169 [Xanthomendoza sp. 2 TL-2023]